MCRTILPKASLQSTLGIPDDIDSLCFGTDVNGLVSSLLEELLSTKESAVNYVLFGPLTTGMAYARVLRW